MIDFTTFSLSPNSPSPNKYLSVSNAHESDRLKNNQNENNTSCFIFVLYLSTNKTASSFKPVNQIQRVFLAIVGFAMLSNHQIMTRV